MPLRCLVLSTTPPPPPPPPPATATAAGGALLQSMLKLRRLLLLLSITILIPTVIMISQGFEVQGHAHKHMQLAVSANTMGEASRQLIAYPCP